MGEQEGEKDLRQAIKKIEDTFDVKITTWYIPYGRKHIPKWAERVCERLGIKADIPKYKMLPFTWKKKPLRKQINFHYWYPKQVKQINFIIKEICKEK